MGSGQGELRLNLRERPAASRRRVMQAYGAVFIYEANELPEEDEADWAGEEQAAEALADNPLAAEMVTMSTMIPTLEPANGENELALAGAGSSNGYAS
ncbi:MAG: hypothetical protein HF973_17845 [Chloroflexi bacterium]|nr:hypothetical protein [Chloroflexota bacterium]